MSMDKIKHEAEELKGKAKEKLGEVTNDASMQAEGLKDQAKAKAEQVVDDVKDAFGK